MLDIDVEADFFLQLDGLGDLRLDEAIVVLGRELIVIELAPRGSHFRRLGERADRCRRIRGKIQLCLPAHGERRTAHAVFLRHRAGPALHRGVVDSCRRATRFRGPAAALDRLLVALRQCDDLLQLLLGECEPALQLRVELGLEIEVERRMQQRARGRHPQPVFPHLRGRPLHQRCLLREIRAPYVATVDHTRRQHPTFGPRGEERIELLGRADEIDVQPLHGKGNRGLQVIGEAGEIRGDQELQLSRTRREVLVRAQVRGALGIGAIERETRLVDLHPGRPRRRERLQHVAIHREQRVEQGHTVECPALCFREQEECQGPDQDRRRVDAQCLRFPVLVRRFGGRHTEALPALQLGDDVVVVGIEPLRHFHRGDVAAFTLTAARHREVRARIDPLAGPTVARRHCADHRAGVQHAVVEREVIGRDPADPDVPLQLPVAAPQFRAGGEQLLAADLAAPIPFSRALQFARRTQGGEAQIRGDCHS